MPNRDIYLTQPHIALLKRIVIPAKAGIQYVEIVPDSPGNFLDAGSGPA